MASCTMQARPSGKTTLLLLWCLQSALPTAGAAQRATVVPDPGPDCPTLSVEALGPMQGSEGPLAFRGPPSGAFRMGDGRILLSVVAPRAPLYLLDPRGGLIEELAVPFSSVNRIAVSPGDSVYVWDQGANELITLNPAFEEVRRTPLPFSPASTLLVPREGLLVSMAWVMAPMLLGHPFHLFDLSDGQRLRSFGGRGAFRADRDATHQRPFSAFDRGIVAGTTNHYGLEVWSLGGDLLREFEREAHWFPRGRLALPGKGETPPAFLSTVRQDRSGLIWTAVNIPKEGWESGPHGSVEDDQRGAPLTDTTDLAGLWDSRIEVIDPAAAEVVAVGLVRGSVVLFLDDEHLVTREPTEAGWVISLWRVTLPPPYLTGELNEDL